MNIPLQQPVLTDEVLSRFEVATEAPDTAAKPAVANTVETANPPGSHATQRLAASNSARVRPA